MLSCTKVPFSNHSRTIHTAWLSRWFGRPFTMDFVPLPKGRLWKSKADFFRPFRAAAAEAGENITPLYDPSAHHVEPEEPDLRELNAALAALVDIFPGVEPEVFREMLISVSPESRLQIVTEQLLSKKAKWVRGRFRAPSQANGVGPTKKNKNGLTEEETFRSESYRKAVKQVFYQEFRSLSHSSIKAVLAEQNFSYTLSRPILQHLSTRSWRFSLSSLWPRRTAASTVSDHPYVIWPVNAENNHAVPSVRRTGSLQLDRELFDLFVAPVATAKKQELLTQDESLAQDLNEKEAEEAESLFDCECCFASVTFESLATCSDDCHQLCFDCLRRTTAEALYGQGWSRTVDLRRSTVRCFAPTNHDCDGIIPAAILKRALHSNAEGDGLWQELQDRMASQAITESRLPMQRCPFCNYVEVDETSTPHRRKSMAIWHHVATRTSFAFQFAFLLSVAAFLIFTVPIMLFASTTWPLLRLYPPAASPLRASWTRVHRLRRGLKFECRSPRCGITSCVRCLAQWRDPHICFENEKTSLRTAVESSATAAIKRTCPRCLLSFVKSSGCNKLVCNCGYALCYVCRQEITHKEGYGHFCQHFRPNGGRCSECDRCDLYGDEDEDAAIRRAAAEAEKAWREKEGGKDGDQQATQAMVEALVGQARSASYWETWLDAVVDALVA